MIEGPTLAILRLTFFFEGVEDSGCDFSIELIDGEINVDANLAIEKHSKMNTVYAIGSQFQYVAYGDGFPLFLVNNDMLKEDVLVFKFVPNDDVRERKAVKTPVRLRLNC